MKRQTPTESDIPMHGWKPYSDVHRERIKAHEKHVNRNDGSREVAAWDDPMWMPILVEEVGEVAEALCARRPLDELREELVQVAAMACAWIDSIRERESTPETLKARETIASTYGSQAADDLLGNGRDLIDREALGNRLAELIQQLGGDGPGWNGSALVSPEGYTLIDRYMRRRGWLKTVRNAVGDNGFVVTVGWHKPPYGAFTFSGDSDEEDVVACEAARRALESEAYRNHIKAKADAYRPTIGPQHAGYQNQETGVEIILRERYRQIGVEGFSPERDRSLYGAGDLALAAACYALPNNTYRETFKGVPKLWPWSSFWWKPTPSDRVRELQKAGALIAAEIDRLLGRQT